MTKIEVRRMNGEAVVPIGLLDEIREHWSGKLADAVRDGEAVVNLWDEERCDDQVQTLARQD